MSPTRLVLVARNGSTASSLADSNRGSVFYQMCNITLDREEWMENALESPRDDEGAMKFVIAVLLVYSLIGTVGTMVLRFRQSAAKRCKNEAIKEAEHYLKHRDKLSYDCHKARLLKETKRFLNQIQTLEDQKKCTTDSPSSFSNGMERGKQTPSSPVSEHPSTEESTTNSSHEHQQLLVVSTEDTCTSVSGKTETLQQTSTVAVARDTAGVIPQYPALVGTDPRRQFLSEPAVLFEHRPRFYLVPADDLLPSPSLVTTRAVNGLSPPRTLI